MVYSSRWVAAVLIAMGTAFASAEEPAEKSPPKDQTTKATFLITGLHCPPCTNTVESSLRKIKGVRTVKVDWKSKNARLEFDESLLSAQEVAKRVAATPHMMGGNMQYSGWLALKVPDLKDEAAGKRVKEALSKVEGVKQVVVYPAQHAVGIGFDSEGSLTSRELIDALSEAEIKAENY